MKKLVTIGVLLVVAALVGFKVYEYQHPEKFPQEEVKTATLEKNTTPQPVNVEKSESSVHISVNPPVNGQLKGVIEVGASGFNSFVVSIDNNKNWELISKEFGKSLAYEGFTTTDDVKSGLKTYLGNIFDKGVAGRNMHFVISSGALKNPKTELIAKAIEQDGYVVNRVTADQEGKYALRALLPKDYIHNSYVVDIGSGNTKISWYEGTQLKSIEASGAKYYQNNKTDQEVYAEIVKAVSNVPSNSRENCFIIGGVPHTLAEESRIEKERYTLLQNADWYSAGDDVKKKSGLNIYRALQEGSGTTNFIFDWDANFTIGFLLTLN